MKRGWKAGTKVIFPREGDQGLNQLPSDVVFAVEEIPHAVFKRQGAHLHMNCNMTLEQALTGYTVDVQTLDGRHLHIGVNDVVKPGYVKIVPGEGMPESKTPNVSGDLVLTFQVHYPTYFTEQQKKLLKQAFALSPQ